LGKLDASNSNFYTELAFFLQEWSIFRDASQGPIRNDQIIDHLDFDEKNNPGEMPNLKRTLFYKSFLSKTVEYVSALDQIQKSYTKKFNSGLVVPVVLHGIAFALICVGTGSINVFSTKDHNIACTFADSIAEFSG
jgi:hypothetical protein